MRKVDVQGVKDDFILSISEVESFYLRTSPAMPNETDKSFLAKSAFLSAAVLWEGFISDLLVAYINRDSSGFSRHLNNAMYGSGNLTEKQEIILQQYCSISIPVHMSRSRIVELIDGKGNNISFPNFNSLEDSSKKWLSQRDAAVISQVSDQDRALYNAVLSIRNFIAHNSERSHKAMNISLGAGSLYPTGLARAYKSVNNVGAYLKARVGNGGASRLVIYFDRMKLLAQSI